MDDESGMEITETDDGLLLDNGLLRLDVATAFGPRIRSLQLGDRPSPFVRLPHLTLPVGDGRLFRMVGGHRLWAAPEHPATTYLPDEEPVAVERAANAVTLTAPAPTEHPLEKRMRIVLDPGGVELVHRLTNVGEEPIVTAAWAVTMLRPGGVALLPLGRAGADLHGAERSIVLWPYTDLDDPRLRVEAHQIAVWAQGEQPTKVGTANTRGWLAYAIDDQVFVKRAGHADGAHADLGATAQVYVGPGFCELETLGPLAVLAPGAGTEHTERWELCPASAIDPDSDIGRAMRDRE